MGLLSGILKAGVAKKVLDVAQEQARKPENQARAKQLLRQVTSRGKRR